MIKKIIFIVIVILSKNIFAQDNAKITTLSVPGSPAFTIIGISPTTIKRPETPEKLAVNLINNFSAVVLPKDFSLEVSPAYIYNDFLTYDEYNSSYQNIWKNFTFSLATTKPEDTNTTFLGFGMRTLILNGEPTKKAKDHFGKARISVEISNIVSLSLRMIPDDDSIELNTLKKNLDDNLNSINTTMFNQLNEVQLKEAIKVAKKFIGEYFADRTSSPIKFNDDVREEIKSKCTDFANKYFKKSYEILRKEGDKRLELRLEAAFAFSSVFKDDSVKRGQIGNFGFWMSPSYEWEAIKLLGLTRLISNRYFKDINFDNGLGILCQLGNLGTSIEVVNRSSTQTHPTYRYTFSLEYKLAESVYLKGSFGKDFEGKLLKNQKGDLITLLGINFGFGTTKNIGLPFKEE